MAFSGLNATLFLLMRSLIITTHAKTGLMVAHLSTSTPASSVVDLSTYQVSEGVYSPTGMPDLLLLSSFFNSITSEEAAWDILWFGGGSFLVVRRFVQQELIKDFWGLSYALIQNRVFDDTQLSQGVASGCITFHSCMSGGVVEDRLLQGTSCGFIPFVSPFLFLLKLTIEKSQEHLKPLTDVILLSAQTELY